MNLPLVSIVVPILHDTDALARLLSTLDPHPDVEIVIVNGDSSDSGIRTLADHRPDVRWLASPSGRGRQMNQGARSARGRWLLFLHADTRLAARWLDELRRVDADRAFVGGSFRFQLDSDDHQARLIERGVAWRVRWFDLAYGDQALFVRRDAFDALEGYREWPLMEDVDLIRRLRRLGRLYHSPLAAVTSARRWEHDGWWRRSARNIVLQVLFLVGVSPRWLATRYLRSAVVPAGREALVVMARAPSDPRGKSRLTRGVTGDFLGLRRALLLDTLAIAGCVRRADVFVAFEPAGAQSEFQSFTSGSMQLVSQRGQTLGDRMGNVFADVFARDYARVIIIGSDLPTVPSVYIDEAFNHLRDRGDSIVLGPATDGGYYLIGLSRFVPEVFDSIPWGTPHALRSTVEAAEKARLGVSMVPEWYDVDEVDDLRRVLNEPTSAERTRSWAANHSELVRASDVSESAGKR